MTTTINNQAQINQIKLNAQRTRSFMDSRTIASIYDVDFYKAHLEDCIQKSDQRENSTTTIYS